MGVACPLPWRGLPGRSQAAEAYGAAVNIVADICHTYGVSRGSFFLIALS